MFGIANNQTFLEEIGIANIPEQQKAVIIAGLEDLAQKKLTIKISERLTDQQLEKFEAITDEQDKIDWITQNIPDFLVLVANILEELKQDILQRKMKVVG